MVKRVFEMWLRGHACCGKNEVIEQREGGGMKLLKAMVCVSAVAFVAGCAAGPEMARGGSAAGA